VAYTREKPPTSRDTDELRRTVPGWGVDLNPEDRPSYPKESQNIDTGARWEFPERQSVHGFREKSTEHKFLTPVFGTVQPLRGLSGTIRRYAYTFSEGRTAHWLLLMAGDRVDVLEHRIGALLRGRPDNPLTESGVMRELKGRAFRSRFGQHRADLRHQPLDALVYAAPYVAIAAGAYLAIKALNGQRG
jgi:hypothetical protein